MSAQPPVGLLSRLQTVLAGLIEIGHNRLELARVEIEEERLRTTDTLHRHSAALQCQVGRPTNLALR